MNEAQVNEVHEAIEFAANNPLGMEILVERDVVGATYGQKSEGATQIVKVDELGNMSAFPKIHGSNYRPMRIKEFIQHVNDFRDAGNQGNVSFGEPIYHVHNGGRRVFAFLPNEGGEWELNGSVMSQSMIIATSFDGTMPLTIGGKTYFYRCANMFSNIHNAAKIRNSKHKMDEHILNYKAEVGGFLKSMKHFHENAQRLMEVELSPADRDMVTKNMLGIAPIVDLSWGEEKLKNEGGVKGRKYHTLMEITKSLNEEMGKLGQNAWGYLNGITHFTTHTKNGGKSHGVDSISMKYNNAAYKELLALV